MKLLLERSLMNIKTKWISFFLICLLFFVSFFQPLLAHTEPRSLSQDEQVYVYSIQTVNFSIHETASSSQITMEGFGSLTDPGKPKLPSKLYFIGLPPDSEVFSVDIMSKQSTTRSLRKPITTTSLMFNGTSTLPVSNPDHSNESVHQYPSHILSYEGIGFFGPYCYAKIRFNPVQQIIENTYRIIENITFSIHYFQKENDDTEITISSNTYHYAERFIENFDDIKSYYNSSSFQTDPIQADYVIIANDSVYPALTDFITWKSTHGHYVKIVNLSTIVNDYSGSDVAARIKTFLRTKQPIWGITYVLLIGSSNTIPLRHSYPMNYDEKSDPVPTDYYYADLTSDWDKDGDGYYGEMQDLIDCTAEVHIGRIPFDNPSVISDFLTKTMQFESTSMSWKKQVLLPAAFLWFDNYKGHNDTETDGAVLHQHFLKDLFQNYGFSPITMYEKQGHEQSEFNSDYPLNTTHLVSEWNTGYGIVNWVGHGRIESFERLVWTKDNGDNIPYTGNDTIKTISLLSNQNDTNGNDVQQLDHLKSAIVFSTGCDNAYIDYRYRQSIAESLLKNGAVVFIGATRDLYGPLNWTSLSDSGIMTLDYLYFYSFIKQQGSTGNSLDEAKTQYYKNYMGTDESWYHYQNILSLTLFGDPSLVIQEAPDEPVIHGPDMVKKEEETDFKFTILDPQHHKVYLQVDWGPDNTSWLGPFESGEHISLSHQWQNLDDSECVEISARAKDEYGFESQWTTKEITLKKDTLFEIILQFLETLLQRWNCPLLERILDFFTT